MINCIHVLYYSILMMQSNYYPILSDYIFYLYVFDYQIIESIYKY